MLEPNLYKVIIDSMSAHVAILDEQGEIIETNRAWQEFGRENGMQDSFDSVGMNYLAICEVSSIHSDDEADKVANGIRKVIAGELDEFLTHYPCHSLDQKRWYAVAGRVKKLRRCSVSQQAELIFTVRGFVRSWI